MGRVTFDQASLYRYAIVAILLLACSLRLTGLSKGIWLDEAYTVTAISSEGFAHMLRSLTADVHPPLYYVLLKVWAKINHSDEFLRLFSVVSSMVTVGLVAVWMKRFSRAASLLAALYFATAPVLLRYSQEIRQYALLLVATLLSFLFSSVIASQPEKRLPYLLLSVSLVLAVSLHLAGIFLLLPLFLFIRRSSNRFSPAAARMVLLAFVPAAAAFFVFFLLLTDTGFHGTSWMPDVSWKLIWMNAAALFNWSYVSWPIWFLSACLLVLLMFGSWTRSFPFLLAGAIYWLEVLLYSMVATPIFWFRTLMPSLVPLVGFAAIQLSTISAKRARFLSFAVCMLLFSLFAVNWVAFQSKQPIENFREAIAMVQSQWRPGSSLIVYPHYVDLPVRHYFAHWSAASAVSITPFSARNEMRESIRKVLKSSPKSESRGPLFVIIRIDSTFAKEFAAFSRLLSVLNQERSKTNSIHAVIVLCGDRFMHPTLIAMQPDVSRRLEAALGRPFSFHDYGGFLTSSWQMK